MMWSGAGRGCGADSFIMMSFRFRRLLGAAALLASAVEYLSTRGIILFRATRVEVGGGARDKRKREREKEERPRKREREEKEGSCNRTCYVGRSPCGASPMQFFFPQRRRAVHPPPTRVVLPHVAIVLLIAQSLRLLSSRTKGTTDPQLRLP